MHNRFKNNNQISLLAGSDEKNMKDTTDLIDIAIRFCIATNEIVSWSIYEYDSSQMSWPTCIFGNPRLTTLRPNGVNRQRNSHSHMTTYIKFSAEILKSDSLCLSPLTLKVRIPHRQDVLDTVLCDKVC